MPSAGSEPAVPAIKRPQTCALDRTTTEIGKVSTYHKQRTRYCKGIISLITTTIVNSRMTWNSLQSSKEHDKHRSNVCVCVRTNELMCVCVCMYVCIYVCMYVRMN